MSIKSRKELIEFIRQRYQDATWKEKIKILDEFIASAGYKRKYAIGLLNQMPPKKEEKRQVSRSGKYNGEVREALITLWCATNQICSKRLVSFLPEILDVMNRCGHLSVPNDVRQKLLTMSSATIDRLLKPERQTYKQGISTTRSSGLLKQQIPIHTFADWNDIIPGFVEADLVAHCGGKMSGVFLNSLVLTDIATGWIECFALLGKGEAVVIHNLKIAQKLLPFVLKGLDTDNGSEFINYQLLKFCEDQKITFTRSRAYRKNDQAHIEEKNGSVVRKLVGYDRYEGEALKALYAVIRLYVNYFQPSVKLISKTRCGSKITKRYDKAQTPYQRLVLSPYVSEEVKYKLKEQYHTLDPLHLLEELKVKQDKFWKYAWKESKAENDITTILEGIKLRSSGQEECIDQKSFDDKVAIIKKRNYRRSGKPRKQRTDCQRKDTFDSVWSEVTSKLESNYSCTVKDLLKELVEKSPDQYSMSHLRTLQRRVKEWRLQNEEQKNYQEIEEQNSFLSLQE